MTAIEQHRMTDGLVFRIVPSTRMTDLVKEGAPFSSFDEVFLQSERGQAQAPFERLISLRNDVGPSIRRIGCAFASTRRKLSAIRLGCPGREQRCRRVDSPPFISITTC
ncbi:hypothetical protein BZM27_39760 [Paraburkholderia steynii]|uniref:Uncharacterized protein n=1 Tax=Paraburkholderia steynii TaxID=1245441 RepID=A0A4R0X3Z1_9BURK|nr:hypothetical protein BZM27_39760 [Paraburkholderia steynii]